jgi:hypothetical protein
MSFLEKSRATVTDAQILIPLVVLGLGLALLIALR